MGHSGFGRQRRQPHRCWRLQLSIGGIGLSQGRPQGHDAVWPSCISGPAAMQRGLCANLQPCQRGVSHRRDVCSLSTECKPPSSELVRPHGAQLSKRPLLRGVYRGQLIRYPNFGAGRPHQETLP
ncbi:unnamed protein product [Macrosiphum euphorbiae]|uniref:Uncharacterized protein n=1 Tax=Macrosiphum euphorbiae TaxID=13131 RepID=A0AAV0X7L5_9HEMI|nr:unnamed protein product [Macrosiphum euphorbiae]